MSDLSAYSGKIAIVTGGGDGIGEMLARKLSQAGLIVAVQDIRAEAAGTEDFLSGLADDRLATAGFREADNAEKLAAAAQRLHDAALGLAGQSALLRPRFAGQFRSSSSDGGDDA